MLKRDYNYEYVTQSNVSRSHVRTVHDHRLLRSTGHQFKDGRWEGSDDPFHVFKHDEVAALGKDVHFLGSHSLNGDIIPDEPPVVHYQFRPAVAPRGDFTDWGGYFGDLDEPFPDIPDYETEYKESLMAQGTSFLARSRPGNPVINLGQFIVELRDLPRIPLQNLSSTRFFQSLGDEYLNVVFGWQPFLKDMVKMFDLQQKIEGELKKLRSNNGVLRRYRPKKLTTRSDDLICAGTLATPFGHLGDPSIGGNPSLEGYYSFSPDGWGGFQIGHHMTGMCEYSEHVVTETVSWEQCTWQYFVPDMGSDRWTEQAKAALFGLNATPNMIYSVIPWSWLVDWFTTAGDVLMLLSPNAVDNLVSTNAHAMRTINEVRTVSALVTWDAHARQTFASSWDIPAGSSEVAWQRTLSTKLRCKASPYGFGLKWTDLSTRQYSILAALGISRVR